MEIIRLQKSDIKPALDLVWTVFEEFEVPDYTDEGIQEFKKFISYDSKIEQFEKGEICFWGCKENETFVGVIATKRVNHICTLFVKKEYHRRGIAKSLFNTVLDHCRNVNNITQITVNSSPYAVEVYHRLGFQDTDKEQTINGIRFTPMRYLIS